MHTWNSNRLNPWRIIWSNYVYWGEKCINCVQPVITGSIHYTILGSSAFCRGALYAKLSGEGISRRRVPWSHPDRWPTQRFPRVPLILYSSPSQWSSCQSKTRGLITSSTNREPPPTCLPSRQSNPDTFGIITWHCQSRPTDYRNKHMAHAVPRRKRRSNLMNKSRSRTTLQLRLSTR